MLSNIFNYDGRLKKDEADALAGTFVIGMAFIGLCALHDFATGNELTDQLLETGAGQVQCQPTEEPVPNP